MPTIEVEGKSILIIGGGPSTLEYNRWSNLDVDYKLTMSTGYLNPNIQSTSIDFFVISTQSNMVSEEFHLMLSNSKDLYAVQELNHLWKEPEGYRKFIQRNAKRLINIHIRENFKLGVAARAILFSILIGFKTIYVVGFDGYTEKGTAQHAFLEGKKELDKNAFVNTYEKFFNSFTNFYKLLVELKKEFDFKLVNLGYGHESNILTKVVKGNAI